MRAICRRRRFIPACAGNTLSDAIGSIAVPVHPRVCGEHNPPGAYAEPPGRFIPACAGNTITGDVEILDITVHPRVCGEHLRTTCSWPVNSGSSPRVRGTRRGYYIRERRYRFIPACAGNTLIVPPTSCEDGSSPRVRGTLAIPWPTDAGERFIPACAGNTWPVTVTLPKRTVHPRVCGEHTEVLITNSITNGSSPRVRGTQSAGADVSHMGGSSPRVRGTQGQARARLASSAGSSPRVRGTLRIRTLNGSQFAVHPRVCGEHIVRLGDSGYHAVHPRVCGEHSSA